MKHVSTWLAGLLALSILSFSPSSFADEVGSKEGGTLFAVQERKYRPGHEFHIAGGWLPQDAFWKGVTADLAYRYHFNDFFALDVVRITYSRNYDTKLKKELLEEFPAPLEADPFEEVEYMATSHAIFKPFYGKSAVFNRRVVRDELYFLIGGGAIAWKQGKKRTGVRPTADFGIGLRYWVTRRVSVRLEALENIHVKADGGTDDMIYLSLGATVATFKK